MSWVIVTCLVVIKGIVDFVLKRATHQRLGGLEYIVECGVISEANFELTEEFWFNFGDHQSKLLLMGIPHSSPLAAIEGEHKFLENEA